MTVEVDRIGLRRIAAALLERCSPESGTLAPLLPPDHLTGDQDEDSLGRALRLWAVVHDHLVIFDSTGQEEGSYDSWPVLLSTYSSSVVGRVISLSLDAITDYLQQQLSAGNLRAQEVELLRAAQEDEAELLDPCDDISQVEVLLRRLLVRQCREVAEAAERGALSE